MLFTLNYHSISPVAVIPDFWKLSVSKKNFSAQLNYLRNNFSVLNPRCDSISSALSDPSIHFLITFDDGYQDILNALEVLVDNRLQALLFLASAFVGEQDFWWHNLEYMHWYESSKADIPEYTISAKLANDWRAIHSYPFIMRQRIPRASKNLRSASDNLGAVSVNRRPVSEDELSQLINSKSFAFGSHTLTHAYLPFLPYDKVFYEILQGENSVSLLTGMKSVAFAYPYGEHSRCAIRALKNLGIRYAFTIKSPSFGLFSRRIDCLKLPRLVVEDWSVDEFSNRIMQCLPSV